MTIVAAILVALASVAGVVLTALTLPGTWLAVLIAAVCTWWRPELMSWWTVLAVAILAAVGEAVELLASAAGAARTGGSRSAGIGAIGGGIVGAIAGSFIVPIVGTIVGAVIGAGVGAAAAERGVHSKGWRESMTVGAGAAAGRAVAVVAKVGLAGVIAAVLIVAVMVP